MGQRRRSGRPRAGTRASSCAVRIISNGRAREVDGELVLRPDPVGQDVGRAAPVFRRAGLVTSSRGTMGSHTKPEQ
jgi:hypothetical protein